MEPRDLRALTDTVEFARHPQLTFGALSGAQQEAVAGALMERLRVNRFNTLGGAFAALGPLALAGLGWVAVPSWFLVGCAMMIFPIVYSTHGWRRLARLTGQLRFTHELPWLRQLKGSA